jgi:hypothetical protein
MNEEAGGFGPAAMNAVMGVGALRKHRASKREKERWRF